MTELGFDKKVARLATAASLTWATNWADALLEEGPDVTVSSAVATLTSITDPNRPTPAGTVGEPVVESPVVNVPLTGAALVVGDRYRLVVTITSSAGNIYPRQLEVHVPF